jgi:hypothetical protein
MAVGISACIFGAQCLAVERFELVGQGASAKPEPVSLFGTPPAAAPRELKPAEWVPWSLISGGAIAILYSMAMRQE